MRTSLPLFRVGLTLSAVAAVLVSAPAALQASLGLATIINVGDLLARLVPDRDPAARWLIGATGVVVACIVTGLIVNYVPGGLTRAHWSIAWAVLSVAVLGVVGDRARLDLSSVVTRLPVRAALASAVLGGIVVGAFAIADAGVADQNRQPLLALSVLHFAPPKVDLMMQAANEAGTYTVTVLADGSKVRLARAVRIPGGENSSVRMTLTLPRARSYWKVVLSSTARDRRQERYVILWKDAPSAP